jgi:hypothetical protein
VEQFVEIFNQARKNQDLNLAHPWNGIPSFEAFRGDGSKIYAMSKLAREVQTRSQCAPANESSHSHARVFDLRMTVPSKCLFGANIS